MLYFSTDGCINKALTYLLTYLLRRENLRFLTTASSKKSASINCDNGQHSEWNYCCLRASLETSGCDNHLPTRLWGDRGRTSRICRRTL